ncbi:hypothetical protein [Thalassotalea sp. Y01]|uniref:hypothetical protein n=1 Tax=Thalassotalea sp. Y01 TaxID=2729613 RepID=UPI00145D6F6E|nr:hypothetical protein [Thalassotalea sp. Y01]NMP14909.1 hypothetical protein [Thalassotalea sp. Y01]
MNEDKQILYLKISIVLGLILLIVGHYILSYSELPQTMGIQGLILGGACMAFGIIFSLPTKMYLTFLLVKRETDKAPHLANIKKLNKKEK